MMISLNRAGVGNGVEENEHEMPQKLQHRKSAHISESTCIMLLKVHFFACTFTLQHLGYMTIKLDLYIKHTVFQRLLPHAFKEANAGNASK